MIRGRRSDSRELFHKDTLTAILHVNVKHVKPAVVCHDHDLRAAAAHGHDAAGGQPVASGGRDPRRRAAARGTTIPRRFGDLDKGKVPGGLPHLGNGLGQVGAHDADYAAAHDL